MAGKDKQDLVLLDIQYAIIHPVIENVGELRKESTVKEETEKERWKRISDMFLARPAYGIKKCELSKEIKSEMEEKGNEYSRLQTDDNGKTGTDRFDIEYAAILPLSDNADTKTKVIQETAEEKQETAEERLERIADMFLARPAYSKDKCKLAWGVKKEDEKMTNKQIKKEKKKHKKKVTFKNKMFF